MVAKFDIKTLGTNIEGKTQKMIEQFFQNCSLLLHYH